MLNIPKVAQYARFSSDNQRSESIDAQIRAMNQFCKQNHWQVFRLSEENGLQIVHHTSEQPQFEMMYIVEAKKPVTAKVYIIDDGEHCTILLAEEY